MSNQQLTYSPFDPDIIADPYPVYRQLRSEVPAYWSEQANTWVLSRYVDVCAALADPATYSSASGIFPTPPGVDMTQLFLPMLIMTDPPRHTALRSTPTSTPSWTICSMIHRSRMGGTLSLGSPDRCRPS